MGVIGKQSIRSTLITYIGFAIGAINMLFVMPEVFTKEQFGLIQVFISFAIQAVTIGSMGMVVVTNKFMPYYKSLLPPGKRDLLTIALVTGTMGMILVLMVAFLNDDLIIRKLNKNSPLFIEYMYLFPLFAAGYFYSYMLDSFNINYGFNVWGSFVREIFYRLFNLVAAAVFAFGLLDFSGVINLYMVIYWAGALMLGMNLYFHGLFKIPFRISNLTRRIWDKMARYSLSSWGAGILSTTLQFIETLAIAGLIGLGSAAVYSIARFLISPVIIPSNSVLTVSLPVISDSWRRHDIRNIEAIYKKSALILVSIGGFLFFLITSCTFNVLQIIPQDFFGSDQSLITQAFWVVVILGTARMIDFSTSVNSHILQTSRKYFRTDLIINLISVVLSIPLNYFLIQGYGIIGAALAYLFLSLFANSFKAIILYLREGLHPFSPKWPLLVFYLFIMGSLTTAMIFADNVYFGFVEKSFLSIVLLIVAKSVVLCAAFVVINFRFSISEDLNGSIRKLFSKIRILLP